MPARGTLTHVGALIIEELDVANQHRAAELVRAGLAERWGRLDPDLNPDLDDMVTAYHGGRTILVLDVSRRPVGTGTLMPQSSSDAEIVRMAVAPTARRQGVGRLIVDELINTARRWEADRVVLETTSTWTDAVSFYQRCGFVITGHGQESFGPQTFFEYRLTPSTTSPGAPG